MNTRHLSDSQLFVACQPIPDDETHPGHGYLDHLADCPSCRGRHDAVARTLNDARRIAELDAEDAFPLERLAQQRDRILARVDDLCRVGKVLTSAGRPGSAVITMAMLSSWSATRRMRGTAMARAASHCVRAISSRSAAAAGPVATFTKRGAPCVTRNTAASLMPMVTGASAARVSVPSCCASTSRARASGSLFMWGL